MRADVSERCVDYLGKEEGSAFQAEGANSLCVKLKGGQRG